MAQTEKTINTLLKYIIFSALLVIVVLVSTNIEKFQHATQTNITSSELIDLTNEQRQVASLNILVENSELNKAAQAKAEDMAQKSYFSHISPDGRKFTSWLQEIGYDYLYAGENLAVMFNVSQKVADAWMKSPSHRANMLSPRYTEIGIGLAEGVYKNKKTYFVVELLGTTKLEATK